MEKMKLTYNITELSVHSCPYRLTSMPYPFPTDTQLHPQITIQEPYIRPLQGQL